ncbi:hypothetical protein X971_2835 [Agrobacterium tumefaciens LBA4213 (Ach5)]|nr:hypothetical protein X971_2835 [Agrobacterium tumefaciens LBA4213 (Ach5)]
MRHKAMNEQKNWQQIASNAGLCENYHLTIEQQGAVLL